MIFIGKVVFIVNTFWDESWKTVDPQRIEQYIKTMDMAPDEIIGVLLEHQVRTVCDAGCGCGIYCAKLLHHGFSAAGFDISEDAVRIAKRLAPTAALKVAEISSTGYPADCFDAVISRDVLDHMKKGDARRAVLELCRIVKPGGLIVFTLDYPDEEYGREPHERNGDGDLIYTGRKWAGMVFHPYSYEEIAQILPEAADYVIKQGGDHFLITLQKQKGTA